MGCDIHSCAEVQNPETGEWVDAGAVFPTDEYERRRGREFSPEPFQYRNYGLFGFLAGVRNYAHCEPLAEPRGVPEDWQKKAEGAGWQDEPRWIDGDYHSHSWFLLSELLGFDYEKTFWNRRITRGNDGAALAEEGEGKIESYREFLGSEYFAVLDVLKTLGEPERVRVVFYFDN